MSKSQKRLAIFLPAMYGGGAERTMLKLARGIVERGHSVDMVLVHKVGPYLSEIPSSIRVIGLGSTRDLFSVPPLMRYLQHERPDAMLSGLHTNIVALWAKRLARVPTRLVVSERNTLSEIVTHSWSDIRMRLMPQLINSFYPWADGIVAVSKGVADDLTKAARLPSERIQVIYNPVVTLDLRTRAQAPLDHPWFKPGEPPVVLAVGRLTKQKDFPTLIAAFARVRQSRPARLLILGEGEERAVLEQQAQNLGLGSDVGMPGFVANPFPYMTQSAVFVLSSRWEGLPGVLIEAMYCGVPLIATDCPSGPREILADGKYGRLIPIGDGDALTEAIRAALDNQIPRPPQESWQPFESDHVVDQYLKVLLGD